MPVLKDIGALAACRAEGGQGEPHLVRDAALAWQGDRITWVGPARDLPERHRGGDELSAGGRLVIPGLVDCHTHLGFAGWRADEFVARIRGATYAEIARGGGGIARTVQLTRAAEPEALLALCRRRQEAAAALGVTSLEAKSGYGLDVETELRLLQVYRRLDGAAGRVVATYLGAHVVPPEHRADRAAYLAVIEGLLPRLARERLARFCDVFVEEGAFTADEARRIFAAARAAGLGCKLHADQLGDGGAAALAAEVGAVSADHLEHVSPAGIAALARAGTVAVSLPVATLYLGQAPMPARALIAAGVPVAVASDFNPGTAPSQHLPLALLLACVMQRMTPAEALKGATVYAARAVGLEDEVGSLEAGKAADFALVDAPDVDHWLYNFRANACVMTVCAGRVVHEQR